MSYAIPPPPVSDHAHEHDHGHGHGHDHDHAPADRHARWDAVGMFLSAACAVHCFLTTLFFGALPAIGLEVLAADGVHEVLALVVLAVAVLAFVPGYRAHRKPVPPALGFSGVVVLGVAAFAPFPHGLETALTVVGATALVTAHLLNYRSCSAHRHAAVPNARS